MAKKEEKPKTVLERNYNVPLRREFQKAPRWRRAKKAVTALREFVSKHMKSDNVLIGRYANELLWKDGIKNPPHHIKVNAVKDDKGTVKVELVELPGKAKREMAKQQEVDKKKKAEEKKKEEEQKKAAPKAEEKKTEAGEAEKKIEETKEDKAEKAKEIQKEEIKELRKEQPKVHAPKQPPQPKNVEQRPTAPKSQ
ncbi:MAG: 50S ribosomal protein L31e [Candidatus Woesearchaeota archaeon]|jgi:large subunit ribosomal protein L31e|nr:50S ribosomal protein L31e [Candidatus Woesearchaeota archaeon]MDP7622898.1 50S ribosomal protein L31e [Candidatus Woesearchaeota archaeon]HJN56647.1 50S ribosomal protein L31e [Candidatus Woesearchaeota archaeon]|tara:strand:+ start:12821 stop:13408 length:588 start_codon:yes stop_codon:yes gene_type:complete